ncbi:MAG: gamma-glutamyl-gamma-aminobutyrate hydrolase family protein [Clostridia bacterium]|nr:gamma-glutamyl-gamma-aminobutyrate hydrolase family protein [Clostridia bacterium]
MIRKPIIGISAWWDDDKKAYRSSKYYGDMVTKAGGIPIILTYTFEGISFFDGVLFTGGNDVPGEIGGYEESDIVKLDDPQRTEFEVLLFNAAFEAKMPILGICRGMQLINCLLGGSLHRDIKEAGFKARHGDECMHGMVTEKGTLANKLYGDRMEVNSIHHQAVRRLGKGFIASGCSDDGVIEAIEHENGLILGLQSHPEMMGYIPPFDWLARSAKVYSGL